MDHRARNQQLLLKERRIVPETSGGDVRVVVAYANRYWLGMSNLGFQAVYRLFSEEPRFNVERAYIPEEEGASIKTFERSNPLSQAEILAVSVSFETDYPYVLSILENAGLNFDECREIGSRSARATNVRPLIIGGGAALTLNPEPLANFFDAIVIGEGEEVIQEIADAYLRARDENRSFAELLLLLAEIEGVYVPSLYTVSYNDDNTIGSVQHVDGAPARVLRRYVKDIDRFPTYTVIQTPETEFKAMFMTETGRGCEVGCKFCVAGYMYRPVRKRSEETIHKTVQIGLETSESIGFVGAAVSSHKGISRLASTVARAGKRASLSSIMSQRVTPELAASLSESEYKTVALAPEAGSETLRFRIGKRVCDEQIVSAVATLAQSGIRHFKLYFMVGLPSESIDDVRKIPTLVLQAREAALQAAREQSDFRIAPTLFLSVNPFIPKAWTPFQRHSFLNSRELKKRLEIVRSGIARVSNVEMKCESPRESYFQVLMSRGDRRVGDLLLYLHRSEKDWRWLVKQGSETIVPEVPPADFYVYRQIAKEERLPWEITDLLIKRSLLDREYERTFTEEVEPLIARRRAELRTFPAGGECSSAV